MQEIYSFYTASRQGGLLIEDIDGDGRPDIVCGNYWIRSPERFDLPWRLFAINTRHETPDSATFRLAWLGRDLIAAQGHMSPGAVYRYTRGADPTQQWKEQKLRSCATRTRFGKRPKGLWWRRTRGRIRARADKTGRVGPGTRPRAGRRCGESGVSEDVVPGAGLEPALRLREKRILSPLRLPISPPGHD